MHQEKWVPLKDIADDEKIWSGTIARIYDGISRQDHFYDYMVTFIYDNTEYLQLSCLSQGEGGNIICVLKREPGRNYSTGKELKRMLGSEGHSVYINYEI